MTDRSGYVDWDKAAGSQRPTSGSLLYRWTYSSEKIMEKAMNGVVYRNTS